MSLLVRFAVATVLGLLASWLGGAWHPVASFAQAYSTQSPRLYGIGKARFSPISSASCAAAACHGGGRVGEKGSEHTTWSPDLLAETANDPHAKAYRVLFNADSARIGKILGIAAPHKDALCLNCHAVDGVLPQAGVSDGVGCGACHGPAEKWIAAHVEPGWKELANRVKWEEYGFVPARNLVARSLNCVSCHVGSADREVNHDLIAAGHPRLAFESVRFHTAPRYRKHWVEATPRPDFEVRAWIAGQAAALRAATELLQVRAERAAGNAPNGVWPEFAGYSCFACHHPIGDDPDQLAAAAPDWEVWSTTGGEAAARFTPEAFPGARAPALPELAALRKIMESRAPDPRRVASAAARARGEIELWLADMQAAEGRSVRLAPDLPRKLLHDLAAKGRNGNQDWDALAVSYLGCAAMNKADPQAGWNSRLRALESELKFPNLTPSRPLFTSPAGFGRKERARVREIFRELYEATAPAGGKR